MGWRDEVMFEDFEDRPAKVDPGFVVAAVGMLLAIVALCTMLWLQFQITSIDRHTEAGWRALEIQQGRR